MPTALVPAVAAIAAFARVAHHGSFTRAAEELGVSPSALSQTVRSLESRLGVRLLDRSTRRVGTTEIGRRFLLDAEPGLARIAAAVDGVTESRDVPAGLLRLNVSRTAADIVVLPHLVDFMAAYPQVTVELQCDNAMVDLIAGGFDAGIRLGENLAQDVVAVPLGGRHRIATVAAPGYLDGRSPPGSPEALRDHRCLNICLPSGLYRWEYMQDGRSFDIEVPATLLCNEGDVLLRMACEGAGIACSFEFLVRDDLAAGRLVALLEPWWPSFPGFYLYHPSRAHVPRKLRVFIDFLRARVGAAAGP
jgi:DNA-binding transcriptional LysR family regulator